MARVKFDADLLEVQSFVTGGGTTLLERPEAAEKKGNVMAEIDVDAGPYAGPYSDMLLNTELCDTDRHCSGWCDAPTNVCYACG